MFFDLGRQSSADLLRAERVGLPVTLIILLVAFGAPLAAGLPVLLALLAVTVSSAALFVLSQITTVSVFSQNVVSMIGLGVGVDYALFIVSSFRNALAQGLQCARIGCASRVRCWPHDRRVGSCCGHRLLRAVPRQRALSAVDGRGWDLRRGHGRRGVADVTARRTVVRRHGD